LTRSAGLCKSSIGRHEPSQHRRNQLGRIAYGLSGLAGQNLSVGYQIAMYVRRQFERELDRLSILECS